MRGPAAAGAARWLLAASLTFGLALRLWGLGFGLPNTEARPDEGLLLHRALAICGGGLNPHFFNYPTFHLYVLALCCGLYYAWARLLGWFGGSDDFLRQFLLDPSNLYLLGRTLTAAMGTVTIAFVYRIGRSLGGAMAGAISAMMMAGAYLHVRDSHFMTVDVPAAFWAAAAYACLGAYLDHPRAPGRYPIAAAALGGLATSTKYNLALFAPAVLYAVGRDAEGAIRVRRVAIAAGAWVAAFLAGSPFVLLDAGSFWKDLAFEWHHFGRGHGLDLGNGWLYHLTFTLRHGLGWPLLATALASLLWMANRRRPLDLAVILGVGTYFALAGSGGSLFVRYAIPLVPLLCAAAGTGVVRLSGGRSTVAIAAAVFLIAPSLLGSVAHDRLLCRTDTRVQASRWIESHVPAGATIGFTGSSYGHPQLRATTPWLRERLEDLRAGGAAGRRLQLALEHNADRPEPTYYTVAVRESAPQELRSDWGIASLAALERRGMSWLVTQSHPLAYASLPVSLQEGLTGLEPVADFDPDPRGHFSSAVFDPIDAYYAPLAGYGTVDRPGPRIRVYRLEPDNER